MRTINLESTELAQVIKAVNQEILYRIAKNDTSFELMCLKSARDKLEKEFSK